MKPNVVKEFINNFKLEGEFSIESVLEETKTFVKSNFSELFLDGNSVHACLPSYNKVMLAHLVREYASFSQVAIHFQVDAMIRNHDWPELFTELQKNLNDKKGDDSKGIPHLEIMREGFRRDLGINVDVRVIEPSAVTQTFLKSMHRIFNNDDNAYSVGALIAFEVIAKEEFHILNSILKEYRKRIGKDKNEFSAFENTLTAYYFDEQKNLNISHEQELVDAIRSYIDEKNFTQMIRGYLSVVLTMNKWWNNLYSESIYQSEFDNLEDFTPLMTSVRNNILG